MSVIPGFKLQMNELKNTYKNVHTFKIRNNYIQYMLHVYTDGRCLKGIYIFL